MENIPIRAQDVPTLLILGYLCLSWLRQASAPEPEEVEMREDDKRWKEMHAVLAAQEQLNAGVLRFLKDSKQPGVAEFRGHVESQQHKLARLRIME